MTKELVQKRKDYLQQQFEEIKAQMEQLKATANAFAGAIQDCDFWLEELRKESEGKDVSAGPQLVPDKPNGSANITELPAPSA